MTVKIMIGHALDELRKLPDDSVHCCVSSPPYWGLRDYGVEAQIWGGTEDCEHEFADETLMREVRKGAGLEELGKRYRGGGKKYAEPATFQITRGTCLACGAWRGSFGLEPTPEMFVDHLVQIFEEVRRVLRPDGTLWMNLGDTYVSATEKGNSGHGTSTLDGQSYQEDAPRPRGRPKPGATSMAGEGKRRANRDGQHAGKHTGMTTLGPVEQPNRMPLPGIKPKDMVGVPWMAAFALRRAGWWLRQEIIWAKPNPMPESIEDRCTKAHEQIFLLTKSQHYYFDNVAIAEPASENTNPRKPKVPVGWETGGGTHGSFHRGGIAPAVSPKSAKHGVGIKANESFHEAGGELTATRNKRSVWTVATQPFPDAHFATFPPALIEPCIKAGTSARGCCPTCRTPWERITARSRSNESNAARAGNLARGAKGAAFPGHGADTDDDVRNGPVITTVTLGWWPGCDCLGLEPLPTYPKKPIRVEIPDQLTAEAEADHAAALRVWLEACEVVSQDRRERCAAVAGSQVVPAVVLDPFGGAGTTALVADRQQRDSILLELNPDYAAMARRRIDHDQGPLFARAAE